MSIETLLHDKLVNDPNVSARVGQRVEPQMAAQGEALPYIVYMRVSGQPWNTSAGYSDSEQARYQIDCFAQTYDEVKALALDVRGAVMGWRDLALDPAIQMSHLNSEIDDVESPSDDSAEPVYRVIQDYLIEWSPVS